MTTIIERLYIDYIYRNVDDPFTFFNVEPGLVVLRNKEATTLFSHPHIRLWHRFLLEVFDSRVLGKSYALILPCSRVKPYRISRLHNQLEHLLDRYGLDNSIQRYIVSEPMVLVPRELDIYYPFANYDYPPEELTERDREIFIELLASTLPKLKNHRGILAVLPKHHKNILITALKLCNNCVEVEIYDYGRKAFRTIKNVVELFKNIVVLDKANIFSTTPHLHPIN